MSQKQEGDSNASDEHLDYNLKRVGLILGYMLVAAGALWALIRLLWPIANWVLGALSPFLVALVVAYLFNPIVNIVQKRFKLGRIGGIMAVATIIFGLTIGFFGLLLPILYAQTSNTIQAARSTVPEMVARVTSWVDKERAVELKDKVSRMIDRFDVDIQAVASQASSATSGLTQGGFQAIGDAFQSLGSFFFGFLAFIVTCVLVLVIAFYYLLEFDAIPRLLRLVLPPVIEDRVMEVLGKVDKAVGGFLRGQLIVCCFVAAIATVGLSFIGMYKYALLIGVIAGIANFVPYLGPVVGAAPGVLWAMWAQSHDNWGERFLYAGLVIGLFAMIQVIDGFLFQPRIVGKNSNLHPIAVMAALVVGGQFGLAGMILAVPLACIARVLFKELWWDKYVEMQTGKEAKA